jgi:hypothetical protein
MERFDVSPIKINHLAFKLSNSGGLAQTAEALVAHPIQQLVFHLLVRKVVQPLERKRIGNTP